VKLNTSETITDRQLEHARLFYLSNLYKTQETSIFKDEFFSSNKQYIYFGVSKILGILKLKYLGV
jgi:hypothetical protein